MAVDDVADSISLRFKYGPQTLFLFVDRLAPFSTISEQLLDVLRECYPRGLAQASMTPDVIPIPGNGESCKLSFALPKNPRDLAAGWKPLELLGTDTPSSLRLKDNTALAFLIRTDDAMGEAPKFNVEVPEFEDEE